MKYNKLIETIAVLNTLERKRFRNVIKNRPKSTLLSLYELCLSQIEKKLPMPPKEEVYRLLFRKKYTKENDFLLRNEYRLLTDEAEDFLRQASIEKYFPAVADAARLRSIIDAGNGGLFQKEFDALAIKYNNDPMFWVTIDPVYLLHFITSSQTSVLHLAESLTKVEECQDRLDKLYNRISSDYGVKRAYTEKVYSLMTEEPQQKTPVRTVETGREDDLTAYRKLKAQTYHVEGNEKIELLLAAEKILKKGTMPELGIDELWWLKATAGLEYYLQLDFPNAIKYFDALFAFPEIGNFKRLPEAVLNYLSALMGVGNHKKAVTVIVPFEEKVMAAPPIFYKYICLKAISLLFLDKPAAARKELNRVKDHEVDYHFVYWKITMLLSFATENRWDEAQNEFKNLLKTKTVKQRTQLPLQHLMDAMNSLIKIGLTRETGKKISAAARADCERKMAKIVNSPTAYLHPGQLVLKIYGGL